MTSLPSNPDVIVVGAGAAGMSAAKSLISKGFEVVVLEADDHVGGRCITSTSLFDTPFDLGGSWLHSAQANPLARLAEQKGIRLHKSPWEWVWTYANGRSLTTAEMPEYNQYHSDIWRAINHAGASTGDVSVETTLPPSPWKETAKHWVPQMLGADADVTSALDVHRYQDAEGDWLVAGGLGAFVRNLHSDVPVRLNCPVTKIDYSGAGVVAETPVGNLSAKSIIVTVSTGVLAAETIRFFPELPLAKQSAIHQLPCGLLNKIGIEFDPSWKQAQQGQTADYQKSGEAFCTLLFGFYDTSLAVGFVSGRFADLLESEGAGSATDFCLQGLKSVFGADVTKSIRRTHETAWRSQPNTLGAYSYALPGGANARTVLAEPIDDKVYFAGEATIPHAYATVHGAYQSGLDIAQKLQNSFG